MRISPKYLALAIAVAVQLCSCGEDTSIKKSAIGRIAAEVDVVETKAVSDEFSPGPLLSERVVATADGFELVEYVYENTTLDSRSWGLRVGPAMTGGSAETKGGVVTRDNIDNFTMDAYAESEWHDNTIEDGDPGSVSDPNDPGLYFSKGVSKSSGDWTISGEPKWLNNVPITFWSWKFVQPTRTDTHKASFGYTVKSDVSKQEDLIFAFNNETRKFNDEGEIQDGKDEYVNIHFYHALSAVQFLEHEDLDGYRISNIEIQGVNSKTTCVMTSTDGTPTPGSPNITFAHTSSTPANFSQSYDADDTSLDIPSTGGKFKADDTKTFIMIPQTLPDDAKLKVTFTYTGTPSATTSPVFDFDGTWKAGKYYVYKIDLTGNVHVKILETCSDTVKSDVKFQNTSNVNEYIRAAVVANWYDAGGNIVAAWDKTRDGDITLGTGWTIGSDGFYYYTQPVATQATTANLFDSFTKPTAAPVTGAHFEMTVMAQAVASDGYSSYSSAF